MHALAESIGALGKIYEASGAGVPTLIHWHGQLPPWRQDRFPWPEIPLIENDAVEAYDYAPTAGTYWMHSHHRSSA